MSDWRASDFFSLFGKEAFKSLMSAPSDFVEGYTAKRDAFDGRACKMSANCSDVADRYATRRASGGTRRDSRRMGSPSSCNVVHTPTESFS